MNAFEEQELFRVIRSNPVLFRALREYFVSRRDARREQTEQATGEQAVVLRGQCRELTAIINEAFKESVNDELRQQIERRPRVRPAA